MTGRGREQQGDGNVESRYDRRSPSAPDTEQVEATMIRDVVVHAVAHVDVVR